MLWVRLLTLLGETQFEIFRSDCHFFDLKRHLAGPLKALKGERLQSPNKAIHDLFRQK